MTIASIGTSGRGRVDWVDTAKGLCIVLVVMMHSTLGVTAVTGETGWLSGVVEFARPFRMPDFFLISGLFLAAAIDRRLRSYLDTKVVHFLYFYALWALIQIPLIEAERFVEAGPLCVVLLALRFFLIEPVGALWFLPMLVAFFLTARAFRRAPWVLAIGATALFLASPEIREAAAPLGRGPQFLMFEYAHRLVFFVGGWLGAPVIFRLATAAATHPVAAVVGLATWAVMNGLAVAVGTHDVPLSALLLGFAGAGAVVITASLLHRFGLDRALAHCGRHSLAIFVAFFFPMAVTRMLVLKFAPGLDVGTVSLVVTLVAIVAPLVLHAMVVRSGIGGFLFERPAFARLAPARARASVPATSPEAGVVATAGGGVVGAVRRIDVAEGLGFVDRDPPPPTAGRG